MNSKQTLFYDEETIERNFDAPTAAMRALWHRLSVEELGSDIPIVVTTWDQMPELRPRDALEFSASMFMKLGIGPRLVLGFERGREIQDVLMTHEIGHQVLNLQGFSTLLNPNQRNSLHESAFNSMAHHQALYQLQRSLGHDPQAMIDDRAGHQAWEFLKRKEDSSDDHFVNGVLIADDSLGASPARRETLLSTAQKMRPKAYRIAKKLLNAAARHDPSRLETHSLFLNEARARVGELQKWEPSLVKNEMRRMVQEHLGGEKR